MPRLHPTTLAAITTLLGLSACRAEEPLDPLQAAPVAVALSCRDRAGCRLGFIVEPANTHAGAAMRPVQVQVQDALGNPVPDFRGNVTIALGTNPGHGHLSGRRTVAVVAGVATFDGLSIDEPGRGYTLRASSGALTPDESVPFNVIGPVTQLEFTVPPTNTAAGAVITPAVFITPLDAFGTPDSDFTGAIAVAIGANPAGGTLSGTLIKASAPGGASFGDLSIDQAGAGYTLVATAAGITPATSAAFDITASTANRLVFTVQPSTTTAGLAISPAVQVTALDASNTILTGFSQPVTVTITIGSGTPGATLAGTTTRIPVSGVVTFADLSVDKAGTAYTLTATASGVSGAVSAAFDIVAGAATHLAFTAQPSTTTAGNVISPPVQVTALDAFDNRDPNFTVNVSVAIAVNPGGGTLSGTTTVTPVLGLAAFPDLSIDQPGSGYLLSAGAPGLFGATSVAFDVF